jgi:hypothetical protein
MKTNLAAAGLALAVLASGCKKGAEADVDPLEKAFPKAAAPAAGAAGNSDAAAAVDLVAAALAAAKANDYPKAAASLTALRAQPALTPDQRAAVQDTMANIQSELARRAAAGDAAAAQALGEVRQMHGR